MNAREFIFEDMVDVIKRSGFLLSVQIDSKDGNKVLVRENAKLVYTFGKVMKADAKVIEWEKDLSQVSKFSEVLGVRRFLSSFKMKKVLSESDIELILKKYPLSERTNQGVLVKFELKRSLNIAQVWLDLPYLRIDESFESFSLIISNGEHQDAIKFRSKLKELKDTLNKNFSSNNSRGLLGKSKAICMVKDVRLISSIRL